MRLDRIGIHRSVGDLFPPDRLDSAIQTSDIEVAIVDDETLEGCDAVVTLAYSSSFLGSELNWIHSVQSGIDRFPLGELSAHDIVLTNSVGIHRTSVGETCVAYVVGLSRGIDRHLRNQVTHVWSRPGWDELFTVADQTACVIGLGTLGGGIAERLDALGMNVIGVRNSPEAPPYVSDVYPPGELDIPLAEARFVVLAVPLTPETTHLIDADALSTMREDAFLINVARGGVVDQPALVAAIQSREIAGAALDVFEDEPLPPESPLWDLERVMITPHTAGLSSDYYRNVAEIVGENIVKLRTNQTPRNLVETP